MKTAFKK